MHLSMYCAPGIYHPTGNLQGWMICMEAIPFPPGAYTMINANASLKTVHFHPVN